MFVHEKCLPGSIAWFDEYTVSENALTHWLVLQMIFNIPDFMKPSYPPRNINSEIYWEHYAGLAFHGGLTFGMNN